MDHAFNVDISDISLLPDNLKFDERKFSAFLQEEIPEKNQNGRKVLDGKKIEDSWFKPMEADFFISHKHEDEEKAKQLGAYLHSKEKSVFIDSCIWGDIKKLQTKIDNDYCLNDKKTFYYYGLRNKSTSYTHMLLANALLKTIVNCKNFVFLNTSNSIKAENIITDTSETNSPWLYFEINVANALLLEKINAITESRENFSSMPEMSFEADLKKFEKVNVEDFLIKCGFEKTEDWNSENDVSWRNLDETNNNLRPI